MATNPRPQQQLAVWNDPQAVPYVQIDRVTKRFGDFVAVNNVSLKIYKKELFCLLGGSGCGKTTLLRMLAGFEEPTSGKLFIDGVDMTGIPPYERPVNMMFQSYALFPHMTVEQNVAFGLKQDGLPKDEIATRVDDMLKLVRLQQFAKRKPHQLSGGQRQRVALARSLVKRPKLLLLDEPLGALDKKLREHTQFELVNLQEQLGVTFVVVTHDQEEAMTLSSRIGVMNQGEIIQVGTPKDIYEYPNSKFVAEFIGNVNMFEGRLIEDEPDHVRIDSPELGGTIYVDHGVSSAPDATVFAAIRPEKFNISVERPNQTDNVVQGTVKEIAYMGDMSVYLVQLASNKMVRITQPNTYRHAEDSITWDQTVYLSWHASSPVVLSE
ncbi:polyamine-transporting ATPase [Steroidobacter agaridevorans]|uniref:Spermidine/putrescine import ATP-binding protein PotA n=1 Tax=Steroidobacter agaridevorans TaxID=2695856 RepID=A0A829YQF2_9GAMM|nr:polyamine ABC transporter ATP-binding protein [Steroidobacter agaridevorans]GFE85003.1 polyamine-transporting ATPase [Steroidobacter agaridevorans]GFE91688.1 polyamine-transporting ATPase [Steroidobacter agaridevorans]